MQLANIYLDIPDRRDSKAVRTALERIITGMYAVLMAKGCLLISRLGLQSSTSDVGDRGSLVKALIDDLADGDGSVKSTWKSWDVESASFFMTAI